jgi:hypothetical protein
VVIMIRRRVAIGLVLFLVGCNELFGIDKATLREDAIDDSDPDAALDGAQSPFDAGMADGSGSFGDSSSRDSSADGSTNDAAPFDAGPDAPVNGGTCTRAFVPKVASQGTVSYGPSLAYRPGSPGLWGLAWAGTAGATVNYNAVDDTGNLQVAGSDYQAAGAVTNRSYGAFPRLTRVGSSFALAYGVRDGSSSVYSAVQQINPLTGATLAGPAHGDAGTDNQAVAVGGVSADTAGTWILAAARLGSQTAPTEGHADLFNGSAFNATSAVSASTRTVSVSWVETGASFGVAYTVSPSPSIHVAFYSGNPVQYKATHPLSGGQALPSVGLLGYELGIAGVGDRFAIAWVDQRSSPAIYLGTIGLAGNVTPSTGSGILVSDVNAEAKYFPRVVYDGTSILVAWVEHVGSIYKVNYRRYTPGLLALDDAPQSVTTGFDVSGSAIGVAASAQREFGLAFMVSSDNKQYFTKLTCTGP